MSVLHEILEHYGMPKENIESAVEQIAETYGACRYLDGVTAGAEAVNELGIQETKENKGHIYSLELTKRQAELLSYACDQFSRLIIGQDWSYQELFEAAWKKRCKEAVGGHGMDEDWDGGWHKMREDAEAICKQIKQRFWGLGSHSMYGIHYDDVADILFALHTVIRHQLWLDKPEDKKSRMTVDSDEPMRIGSEPLALIRKTKSIWHDSNKEQPNGERHVLSCDIERQCDIAKYVKVNQNHIWAYIEDLVPDFKNVIK